MPFCEQNIVVHRPPPNIQCRLWAGALSAEVPAVVTGFAGADAAVGGAVEHLSEETKIKKRK